MDDGELLLSRSVQNRDVLLTFNDMIADQVKGAEDASELESGTDPQALVREAIERLVDYDDWFVREARKAWRRSSAARR